MTALTPEAARAAADAYAAKFGVGSNHDRGVADWFRHEADRMEKAAKTPGQVLAEEMRYENWPRWSDATRASYENYAAAVIAHHVGPDRVVVDQTDVKQAVDACALNGYTTTAIRLREALS